MSSKLNTVIKKGLTTMKTLNHIKSIEAKAYPEAFHMLQDCMNWEDVCHYAECSSVEVFTGMNWYCLVSENEVVDLACEGTMSLRDLKGLLDNLKGWFGNNTFFMTCRQHTSRRLIDSLVKRGTLVLLKSLTYLDDEFEEEMTDMELRFSTVFDQTIHKVVYNHKDANWLIGAIKEVISGMDADSEQSYKEMGLELYPELPTSFTVAGGVYRDALLGVSFSDIDIFFEHFEDHKTILKTILEELAELAMRDGMTHLAKSSRVTLQDIYGANTFSYKSNAINLILTEEENPEDLIRDFSASCSRIGRVISVNGKSDSLVYDTKEMQEFLFAKRIYCKVERQDQGLSSLGKYLWKLGQKPHLSDYTFLLGTEKCLGKDIPESLRPTKGSHFISRKVWSEVIACAEMLQHTFSLEGFDTRFDNIRDLIVFYHLKKGLDVGLSVLYNLIKEDLLSEGKLHLIRNSFYHTPEDLVEKYGLEDKRVASIKLGWGLLELNNELDHIEHYEALVSKKYRKIFSNSYKPSLLIHAKGLADKVMRVQSGFVTLYMIKALNTKFNKKALPQCSSLRTLCDHIVWQSVLGPNTDVLSSYMLNHSQFARSFKNAGYTIPVKFQRQVANSLTLCSWIFDMQLKGIVWEGNSAKNCVIETLRRELGDMAEDVYENSSLLEVLDYVEENPVQNVEHKFLEVSLEKGGLALELLPKEDTRNLYIGNLTGCCQTIGSVGESVCTEGWNDPYSVNYVFKSTTSGKILGNFWTWETVDGDIVIDSIEGRSHVNPQEASVLVSQFVEAYKAAGRKVFLSTTGYGLTRDVVSNLEGQLYHTSTPNTKYNKLGFSYSYMDCAPESNCYVFDNESGELANVANVVSDSDSIPF